MVWKALASLDAWLARAEEVLREQRDQALSPSHVPAWDSGRAEEVVPLAGFEETDPLPRHIRYRVLAEAEAPTTAKSHPLVALAEEPAAARGGRTAVRLAAKW